MLCDCVNKFEDYHSFLHSKESAISTPGLSAVSANRCSITASPVGMPSKGKSRKWSRHIALFGVEYLLIGRSRSRVGVGVGVGIFRPESELETELLKTRRLHSPYQYKGSAESSSEDLMDMDWHLKRNDT